MIESRLKITRWIRFKTFCSRLLGSRNSQIITLPRVRPLSSLSLLSSSLTKLVEKMEIVTIIGYGMKSRRFIDLHRLALRWPLSAFNYIGIDNDGETSMDYEGEQENGYKPFEKDLYGCHDYLAKKRRSRNPYRRFHGYHSSGTFDYLIFLDLVDEERLTSMWEFGCSS